LSGSKQRKMLLFGLGDQDRSGISFGKDVNVHSQGSSWCTADLLIKRLVARDRINGGNDGTISGVTPRPFRREKMESVTNTKHTPGAPGLNTLASEPKADARGGQFERQIRLLSERKDALKKELAVLDRQERSSDAKPCSQNRSNDPSDCRSSNEKKKILNEEISVLNKEMKVLNEELKLVNHSNLHDHGRSFQAKMKILNEEMGVLSKEMKVLNQELKLIDHSKPHVRGKSFHEKMKILNEEMQVLNKEMQILNKELKLVDHSRPHRPNPKDDHHGQLSNEKMKILNQEIRALNEELNALNKELEALNKRRVS
jgi:chromosome segregation ATPase